jgi:hypothetical protein
MRGDEHDGRTRGRRIQAHTNHGAVVPPSALRFRGVPFAVGIEIRKQGCVTFFQFVRWEEIESYNWRQSEGVLFLCLKLHNNPVLLEQLVHPARKELDHESPGEIADITRRARELLESTDNRLGISPQALISTFSTSASPTAAPTRTARIAG